MKKAARSGGFLLFFVQFENSHKSFGRQLNSTEGTHFFLPFPPGLRRAEPLLLKMLGRSESALRKFSAALRILEGKKKMFYSSSSLRTAMKASVGS